MRLGFGITALLIALGAAPLLAQAQLAPESANFTIVQGKNPVGKASYRVETTGNRYTIRSEGNLAVDQLKYAFSNTGVLTQRLNIASQQLSGTVNGAAATFAVSPDPEHSQFAIDISAKGKPTHNTVQRNAFTVFVPDFDPSSYVVLLHLAAQNPSGPFWVLIPKQNGILSPAEFVPDADAQGTLNGAQVLVKQHLLTIGSVTSAVYSSQDMQLLEVDIPEQGFAMVRDGFQMKASDKAPAPPQSPPSDDDPGAQPQ